MNLIEEVLCIKEKIESNEEITKDIIDFYIRYDQICFFEIGLDKIAKHLLENISKLSFCHIKFRLVNNNKSFDCYGDNFCRPTTYGFRCSILHEDLNFKLMAVSCDSNSFVGLNCFYEIIKMENNEIINTNIQAYKICRHANNNYYIRRDGSLCSSQQLFRPIGFFRDFSIKGNCMVAIRENGNLACFYIGYISSEPFFENNEKYKKVTTDGKYFGGITETGKIMIFSIRDKVFEQDENYFEIDSYSGYLVASNGNHILIRTNKSLKKHDYKDVIKIRCQKNFYAFLTSTQKLYYYKENFIELYGNYEDFEISEKYIFAKTCKNKYVKMEI